MPANPESKVHRDCGGDEFHRRDSAIVETALVFNEHGWMDMGETIVDAERDGAIYCDDCGDEVEADDLITQAEYDACEHTDSEDGYCLNCSEYVGPEADDFEVDG